MDALAVFGIIILYIVTIHIPIIIVGIMLLSFFDELDNHQNIYNCIFIFLFFPITNLLIILVLMLLITYIKIKEK